MWSARMEMHTCVCTSEQTSGVAPVCPCYAQVCACMWVCVCQDWESHVCACKGLESHLHVHVCAHQDVVCVCVNVGSERMGFHAYVCAQWCAEVWECTSVYEHEGSAWTRWHKCVLAQVCAKELCCIHVYTMNVV